MKPINSKNMKTTLANSLHIATWIVAGLLTLIPLFKGQPIEQFTGTVKITGKIALCID